MNPDICSVHDVKLWWDGLTISKTGSESRKDLKKLQTIFRLEDLRRQKKEPIQLFLPQKHAESYLSLKLRQTHRAPFRVTPCGSVAKKQLNSHKKRKGQIPKNLAFQKIRNGQNREALRHYSMSSNNAWLSGRKRNCRQS